MELSAWGVDEGRWDGGSWPDPDGWGRMLPTRAPTSLSYFKA